MMMCLREKYGGYVHFNEAGHQGMEGSTTSTDLSQNPFLEDNR